jgi:hypothetical protein
LVVLSRLGNRYHFAARGPSKYAWPYKLAELVGCNVVNNGNPGAGNLEILHAVLNYSFDKDDICVILWSQFVRHDFYVIDSEYRGSRLDQKSFLKCNDIESQDWISNNRTKNWLTIQHVHLYLDALKIKHFSILGIPDNYSSPPPNINVNNMDLSVNTDTWFVDKGLDSDSPHNGHPGVESHKKLANIYYDNLIKHVLY